MREKVFPIWIKVVGDVVSECRVVVQPTLGYHITNNQSRYITPTHLKSAQYSLHNKAPSSRKLLKMDVLTSETCWAVNWHNKASVIKLVYFYSNINMMHGPIRISVSYLFFVYLKTQFIVKIMVAVLKMKVNMMSYALYKTQDDLP